MDLLHVSINGSFDFFKIRSVWVFWLYGNELNFSPVVGLLLTRFHIEFQSGIGHRSCTYKEFEMWVNSRQVTAKFVISSYCEENFPFTSPGGRFVWCFYHLILLLIYKTNIVRFMRLMVSWNVRIYFPCWKFFFSNVIQTCVSTKCACRFWFTVVFRHSIYCKLNCNIQQEPL